MSRNIRLPGKIIVEDDMKHKVELKGSLVALFYSDKLRKSYEKDPDKRYSLKDLIGLMVGKNKCSPETMRRNVSIHFRIFEKDVLGETRMSKHGIKTVNVHKLKPFVNFIFKAIERLQDEK